MMTVLRPLIIRSPSTYLQCEHTIQANHNRIFCLLSVSQWSEPVHRPNDLITENIEVIKANFVMTDSDN